MAGNQSRGLIAASKTKGWDPTVIVDRKSGRTESIANFDKDQGNLPGKPTGDIPGGPPSLTSPGPKIDDQDWSTPSPSGDGRTVNADPNPGMPGATGGGQTTAGSGGSFDPTRSPGSTQSGSAGGGGGGNGGGGGGGDDGPISR